MPGAPDLRTTDTAVSYVSRDGQLRTVDIRVWYRAGGATVASPLIVVSHGGVGAMGAQDRFGHLAELYTAAGFVTAVLNHPPSTNAEPGHRFDRPDDVTAVLDHLTHFSMPGDFNGVIDTANTGHVGHSYGAYTAHAVGGAAFDQGNFRDPRVQAIVPLSAQGDARFGSFDVEPDIRLPSPDSSWAAVTIPTYNILGEYEADNSVSQIFQSDDWRCLPYARYANRQDAFLSVVPAGLHSDFGDQGEEAVKAFVARNTLLFFDRYPARPRRRPVLDRQSRSAPGHADVPGLGLGLRLTLHTTVLVLPAAVHPGLVSRQRRRRRSNSRGDRVDGAGEFSRHALRGDGLLAG